MFRRDGRVGAGERRKRFTVIWICSKMSYEGKGRGEKGSFTFFPKTAGKIPKGDQVPKLTVLTYYF